MSTTRKHFFDNEIDREIRMKIKETNDKKKRTSVQDTEQYDESQDFRTVLGIKTADNDSREQAKKQFNPFAISQKYHSEIQTIGSLYEYKTTIDPDTGKQVKLIQDNEPVIKSIVEWDQDIEYDIKRGIETYDSYNQSTNQRESINEQTIINDYDLNQLADIILEQAITDKVSDLMIVQYQHFGIVRFSKGPNSWFNQRLLYKSAVDPLITIFKDRAKMKIKMDNAYEPQTNGSIVFKHNNFRVATGSNQYGMFIVLRRQGKTFTSLDDLNFPDLVKSEFRNALKAKDGLIIVGGPVGSGKTTLMTTGLIERLHETNGSINIISLEKPIETPTPGIIQEDISDEYNISWSSAIQAALREMPTILRVGEVNEEPAAKAIVKAANSGIIALTTLHIKSTLEVFETLQAYGVSENDIKNSLRLVIYLNRVPKLCPNCKIIKSTLQRSEDLNWINKNLANNPSDVIPEIAIRNPKGCEKCRLNQNDPSLYGTLGKISVYELLKVNQPLLRAWRYYQKYDNYVLRDKLIHPETIHYDNPDDEHKTESELHEQHERDIAGLMFYPLRDDIFAKLKDKQIDLETARYLLNA